MPVVFKGGTSGNREDALPPVPSSGSAQPVLNTETSGPIASTVNLFAGNFRPHAQTRTPDFMPTGGTIPKGSSDIQQQDVVGLGPNSGDESVFKGAPSSGTSGGPATAGH
jgi:hypothetical protein